MHWDLMLETGPYLMTFRLETPPDKIPLAVVALEKIADHDLKFLTYSGPVNKGQGYFEIVESGTFELLSADPGRLDIRLTSPAVSGHYTLEQVNGPSWQLSPSSQP